MSIHEVKLDQQMRYRLIEIIALWEGRVTTTHLCTAFGIAKQQAGNTIKSYISLFAQGELIYDKSLKGYTPSENFIPRFCEGHAHEYLQLLDKHDELGGAMSFLNLKHGNTKVLSAPSRYVDPQIVRTLVRAARNRLSVEVEYESLFNLSEDPELSRLIAPHTLVFDGFRWHVRAWCEKNQEFRDFVVSRFRGTAEIDDTRPPVDPDRDINWQKPITVTLIPNPRLNERQQKIVAKDNGMDLTTMSLTLTTTVALKPYYLSRLNVAEPYNEALSAEAQQVVCCGEVKCD